MIIMSLARATLHTARDKRAHHRSESLGVPLAPLSKQSRPLFIEFLLNLCRQLGLFPGELLLEFRLEGGAFLELLWDEGVSNGVASGVKHTTTDDWFSVLS